MARGSFVCNASIVGLWLGTGGGLRPVVHLFVMLVIFGLCSNHI